MRRYCFLEVKRDSCIAAEEGETSETRRWAASTSNWMGRVTQMQSWLTEDVNVNVHPLPLVPCHEAQIDCHAYNAQNRGGFGADGQYFLCGMTGSELEHIHAANPSSRYHAVGRAQMIPRSVVYAATEAIDKRALLAVNLSAAKKPLAEMATSCCDVVKSDTHEEKDDDLDNLMSG